MGKTWVTYLADRLREVWAWSAPFVVMLIIALAIYMVWA